MCADFIFDRETPGRRAMLAGMLVVLTFAAAAGQEPVPAEPPRDTAAQDVRLNPSGLFDVHVRGEALPNVLRLLSREAERNITISGGVTESVSADLYEVTFEEALDALLAPHGYVWFTRGKFIHVCTAAERAAATREVRPPMLRVFELHYIAAADLLPLVSDLLSEEGLVTSTGAAKVEGVALTADDFNKAFTEGLGGKSRAVGEFIAVRDVPDVLDEVASLVERLDVRPKQVLIEAVILRARLNELNALGVDFNALAGVDFRALSSTSMGGTGLTPGEVPPQKLDNGLAAFQTGVASEVSSGGLNVGLIFNNVGMFIRALEEVVDVTIVANPKILAVNEQPGRMIVGRKDGYLTTTVTETAAVQTVEFIDSGTQILIRPFIGADGYIRMDIHPEDSSGGLTPDNLPFKDTTEVTTNVVVKDGHTLVIGGLFRTVVTSDRNQVPWLGTLPLVGHLFRGANDQAVREEVIVLITPHIIAGAEADAAANELLAEVERWRVLAHRGLMPWGRERLAQSHYRWALEHHRAGRVEKALWDLDLALGLNPRFTEANRLRAQLAGRDAAEPDGSVVRDVVQQLVHRTLEDLDGRPATDDASDTRSPGTPAEEQP